MTRQAAHALQDALAEAGFSSTCAVGVHPAMAPREHASVTVPALRLPLSAMQRLDTIASEHRVEAYVTSEGVEFCYPPSARAASKR